MARSAADFFGERALPTFLVFEGRSAAAAAAFHIELRFMKYEFGSIFVFFKLSTIKTHVFLKKIRALLWGTHVIIRDKELCTNSFLLSIVATIKVSMSNTV